MKRNWMYFLSLVILLNCFSLIVPLHKGAALAVEQEELKPLELDNTEWGLALTSLSDSTAKVEKDTLIFEDEKVITEGYRKKGFDPTNYTVSVKDDGTTVWETMQTKGDQIVFWRGELRKGQDDVMRGVTSIKLSSAKTEDYSFFGGRKAMVGAAKPAAKKGKAKAAKSKKASPKKVESQSKKVIKVEEKVPVVEEKSEESLSWWRKIKGK